VIAKLTGSTGFRALLTAIVLLYLLLTIDLVEAGRAIARLPLLSILIVLALLAADRVVTIWRWIVLVRATGQQVSVKSAAWIHMVSSFVGVATPGGIGGDAARAYTLAQRTTQGSDAVASIAMDRVLGLFSLVLVGLFGVLLWGRQTGTPAAGLALLAILGGLGCVALLWIDRFVGVLVPIRLRSTRIGTRVVRIADAISQYRGHQGVLAFVLTLSVVVQVLRMTIGFTYYLVFMPVGLITMLLPISLGGFGLPQLSFVLLLEAQGVPRPDALALSTLIIVTGLVANLPGALLYLRSRRA
jgi:uncharacterized membrane protein YbhN (UPF0104 family)